LTIKFKICWQTRRTSSARSPILPVRSIGTILSVAPYLEITFDAFLLSGIKM
jgi:hypothetical protein